MPNIKKHPNSCLLFVAAVLLLCSSAVLAQPKETFRVASFGKDPTRTSALSDEYKKTDKNKKLYAIIHVTSNNPGDDLSAYTFNFGYISSFQQMHGDELWVYVAKDGRKLKITRTGFADVQYTLPDKIEAGMDYVMQLSMKSAAVLTRMVEFNIQPAAAGAVVMVKSNRTGAQFELFGTADTYGKVAKSLELGTYEYTVAADNYHTSQGLITLTRGDGNHVEQVTLRANFGQVTLKSADGADIYLNGELKGRGSWSGTLKAGNYAVECRLKNHTPSNQYITVAENDTRTFTLDAPKPITGTLAVTSTPSGASITIDGKDSGYTTPRQIGNLIIGSHTVTLSMKNRKPETRNVEIRENQTTSLDVMLSDIAQMTIRSNPSGASLQIDGHNVGNTPYSAEMASGDYSIHLTYPRFLTFNRRVHLDSSNPEHTFVMKRQLQQKTSGYAAIGYQAPSVMALTATAGMYIYNVNLEVSYLMGTQHSGDICWNYTGTDSRRPVTCRYKAGGFGSKLGYGIIIGTRWRITPQAGANVVGVKSDNGDSRCHVVQGVAGVRADFAIVNHFGVYVAPEYDFAIKKSDIYGQIEPFSPIIRKWGSGFNVRAGLTFFF